MDHRIVARTTVGPRRKSTARPILILLQARPVRGLVGSTARHRDRRIRLHLVYTWFTPDSHLIRT